MSKSRTAFRHDIIVCDACGGKGMQTRQEVVDYRRREYEVEVFTCLVCNGSGRLERKVTTETWPYVPKEVA